MLATQLNSITNVVVSGVCNDAEQYENIFNLISVNVIIIISNNESFIRTCLKFIGKKSVLIICPSFTFDKINCEITKGLKVEFIYLNDKLINLKEKINKLIPLEKDEENTIDTSIISKREKEILQLILRGKKNKEIAEHLYLSVKTVENHRNNILSKTKASSMLALINDLYKIGFLK